MDDNAFAAELVSALPMMRKAAIKYMFQDEKDAGGVEDVVQEAALRAWTFRKDQKGQTGGWLYMIVRNVVFDRRRKIKRRPETQLPEEFEYYLAKEEAVHFTQEEEWQVLSRAVARLEDNDKLGLLVYLSDLGRKTNTDKTRYRRACEKIRKIIEQDTRRNKFNALPFVQSRQPARKVWSEFRIEGSDAPVTLLSLSAEGR